MLLSSMDMEKVLGGREVMIYVNKQEHSWCFDLYFVFLQLHMFLLLTSHGRLPYPNANVRWVGILLSSEDISWLKYLCYDIFLEDP